MNWIKVTDTQGAKRCINLLAINQIEYSDKDNMSYIHIDGKNLPIIVRGNIHKEISKITVDNHMYTFGG